MYDNYNYPPGADTPDAPWNQVELPEIDVKCNVSVTLNRDVTVCTDNYNIDVDEEDGSKYYELDSSADLADEYTRQCRSIPSLLDELAKYIRNELDVCVSSKRKQDLKEMLKDCQGWTQEYVEIEDYHL